jgi:exopolysaccharide biosynthesis polyprenyl glycosylphosphotransferase
MGAAELTVTDATASALDLEGVEVVDADPSLPEVLAVAEAPPWGHTPSLSPARAASRRRESNYRRLLAAADLASLGIALVVGILLVSSASLTPYVALLFPALIVLSKLVGLYDRDQHLIHKSTLDEVPRLFQVAVFAAFGVFLLGGTVVSEELTSGAVLAFMLTLFAALASTRALARQLALRVSPVERCVVIGNPELADDLAQRVDAIGGATVEFVGRLNDDPGDESAQLGPSARISKFLVEHDIHRVVIAPGAENRGDMLALVGEIKSLGVKISVLPSVSQAGGTSFEVDQIAGVTLLGVRGFEFTRSSQIIKRSMDVAISGTAIALLSPLAAAVALAIKLTSPGPVFYRQTRVGRHGERFEMLKFRTMYENADALRAELEHLNEAGGGLFKIAKDPRVTSVGRLLRSLSIDELPQLINVLRGEMSLVGPRPLVVEEDRLIEGWHRKRLSLTPGMTGHWQVLGSARIPLDEMVKLDYAYVQNWSAWRDIQLLLRTVPFVLARRGL